MGWRNCSGSGTFLGGSSLCTVADLSPSKVKRSWDPERLFIATMYSCLGREEAKKCNYFIFQWLGQAGQAALPPSPCWMDLKPVAHLPQLILLVAAEGPEIPLCWPHQRRSCSFLTQCRIILRGVSSFPAPNLWGPGIFCVKLPLVWNDP